MPDLAVLILTYNEERHIGRALAALRGVAREVFVVDSYSTDRTVEIAEASGAVVLKNTFVNQAKQFEWGLENAAISSAWVMRLDADEVLTPELGEEIRGVLPQLPPDVTGVNLHRRHIFLDRWIRHGGRYPLTLLRLWRRGAARIERRWMDEHMVLRYGRTVTFQHDFADYNVNDLTYFTEKHNKYATREAIDVLMKRYRLGQRDDTLTKDSVSLQASAKRWMKLRVYNRMPFWLGPALYFAYRYFLRLGFLDGSEGLTYHLLQGFWYRFLVGAKVLEFDRVLKSLRDEDTRLQELARLSGYKLGDLKSGTS